MQVLTITHSNPDALHALLARYRMWLQLLAAGAVIPGSHWGESEAGLVGNVLYARPDTPVHSVLHETCHYVCMTAERRNGLHTDAGGDELEENGVCYLQILLADEIPGFGRAHQFADMDAWGYSFRLGSAQKWFEQDAEDARAWLIAQKLITADGQPTWKLRT